MEASTSVHDPTSIDGGATEPGSLGLAVDALPVFDLGIAPYEPVQGLQARLRRAVAAKALPGVVLLLEHEPVITLGSRGALEDLCDPERIEGQNIPVIASERGGQATLHAPGQLVSYLIVPIPRRDLRRLVHNLEEVLVVLLAEPRHRRPTARRPAGIVRATGTRSLRSGCAAINGWQATGHRSTSISTSACST